MKKTSFALQILYPKMGAFATKGRGSEGERAKVFHLSLLTGLTNGRASGIIPLFKRE
jgi:hypothetical protein